MRINDNYDFAALANVRAAVPARAKELVNQQVSSFGEDSVSGLGASTAAASEKRVASLKQMVETGTYAVDPQQVSKSMVREHLVDSQHD